MLPDYPKLKAELSELMNEFLRERTDFYLGPMNEIARSKVFEGDAHSLTLESGETQPTEFDEQRAGFEISDDELPTLRLDTLLQRLDTTAQEMARQFAGSVYGRISDAVEQAGNVVDAKGQKVSPEMILELFSGLQIDFNADLSPRLPSIHIHPSLSESLEGALREIDSDRMLRDRFRQVIDQKREEWRAREASRKLVG
jgi:hypothetical protein